MTRVVSFLGLLILAIGVNAIDYKNVEEGGIPPLAQDLNVDWVSST